MLDNKKINNRMGESLVESSLRTLLLMWLIAVSLCASNDPSWISSSLIKAGIKTIVSGGAYQESNWQGPYIATYSTAFSSSANSGVGLVAMDVDPAPNYIEYKVNLNNPNSATQLEINMNYVSVSWASFKVSYIAIDSSFTFLKVSYLSPTYTTENVTSGTGSRTHTADYDTSITFDSSHELSIIPFMTGIKAGSSSLQYSYGLTFSKLNDSHISYTLSAGEDTLIYEITSYILVYDITLGEAAQEVFLDNFQITGSSSTLDPFSVEHYAAENMIVGLSSLTYTSGLSFQFDTANLQLQIPTPSAQFSSISFSFWSFRERSCPIAAPYYEKQANLCYDTCPNTHVGIDPQKYCQKCSTFISQCSTCSSQSVCTGCTAPFELKTGPPTTCECPDNKYADGSTCSACSVTCKTCSGPLETECLSCDTNIHALNTTTNECDCLYGEYATGGCKSNCDSGDCVLCPTDTAVCTQCKNTFLLNGGRCRCPSEYYYDISTRFCYPCHETCYICTDSSATDCAGCHSSQNRELNVNAFTCDCKDTFYAPNSELVCIKEPSTTCPDGYQYNDSTGYCDDICGDGKVMDLECDDGNTDSLDGCSSECSVEDHFSCLYGDSSSPSICSYDGHLIFRVQDARKDIYSSSVSIVYGIEPVLPVFERFPDFSSFIVYSGADVSIESSSWDAEGETLNVSLAYRESLVGKTLLLSYTPPTSPYSHAILASSESWVPAVSNGLSLSYYSEETYETVTSLYYFTISIVIVSLILFVLALFFRKMIGVEQMCLIQASFLSYICFPNAHPYAGVITTWGYVFGYNDWSDISSYGAERASSTYWAIGFHSIFGLNVNFMLLTIVFLYSLSGCLYVISRFTHKSTSRKLREAAVIFSREIAFGVLLLSLANFITSYAVEYESQRIWTWAPEYSGAFKTLSLVFTIINFIVYGLYYKESVESYVFYNKRDRKAQLQPIFIASRQIIFAAGIFLFIQFQSLALYCLLVAQAAYFGFLIYLRPFKRNVDLARSLLIEFSIAYVLGVRLLAYSFVNHDEAGDWEIFNKMALPLEFSLIGLCCMISWISLGIHLFKASKRETQINPGEMYSEVDLAEEKDKDGAQYQIQNQIERDNLTRQGSPEPQKLKQKLLFSAEDLTPADSLSSILSLKDRANSADSSDTKLIKGKPNLANGMEIMEIDED